MSTDAEASSAAVAFSETRISGGDDLILMSDGFASLVTDYGRYTAETLASAIRERGLGPLAQELRQIEQEDVACLRFPRFKVSDDATALWLKVGGRVENCSS